MYKNNIQICLILITAFIILLLLIFIESPIALAQTNDNYDLDSLINKGRSLFNSERYQEAIENFDRALEIDPNYVAALYNKGISLDKLGKHEEAALYFNKAAEIDPNYNGNSLTIVPLLNFTNDEGI
jgi:tetratricopeptide (TPR) repeat protein